MSDNNKDQSMAREGSTIDLGSVRISHPGAFMSFVHELCAEDRARIDALTAALGRLADALTRPAPHDDQRP